MCNSFSKKSNYTSSNLYRVVQTQKKTLSPKMSVTSLPKNIEDLEVIKRHKLNSTRLSYEMQVREKKVTRKVVNNKNICTECKLIF